MRRFFLILALSLTLTYAFCQDSGRPVNTLILPEHAIGFSGGVNFSFFNFKPVVSQPRMPVGVNVGLQYRMILEKYFGLWFQLNYSQRGFKTCQDGRYFPRRFDYVELPVFAHFTFGKRLFRFHFDLGPCLGYLVYEDKAVESELNELALSVSHRFDWGVTGMIGFEINTAKAGIYMVNVRYNSSFADVFTRSYEGFSLSTSQSITVNAGWMWRIKPKKGYQAYDLRAKKK